MADKIGIHWFRLDLRLNDNPALEQLSKKVDQVIPIYIFDKTSKIGQASKCWLEKSLEKLNEEISKFNSKLYLFQGDPKIIISKIIKDKNVSHFYWNRLYDQFSIKRDKDIKSFLIDKNISCNTFNGYLLTEPWNIKNKSGTFFKVFTPFWKTNFESLRGQKLNLNSSGKFNFYKKDIKNNLKVNDLKLNIPEKKWMNKMLKNWDIGEKSAKYKLKNFINTKLSNYSAGRDRPDIEFTSKLSPHIHFGEISPKRIFSEVMKSKNDDENKKKYLSEIGWRDFSYNLLFNYPEMTKQPIQLKFKKFPWLRNNDSIKNWKMGQTGVPIVDAGMKELYEIGWMHNRVRMIVGSFLTKNLLIHWKEGEKWFFDTLTDADIGSNSAGWQWISGSGADASPYFRIFNPILQGKKFDPKGDYVRKFIPTLIKIPDKFVHSPWEMSIDEQEKYNFKIGKDYPSPIVDLSDTRKRALAAFKSISE
ncbi:deoxyribodipyrimidine photo-lyase [Alphaproteobacteria bacterium]|nr:deoxyribodipyrimidine photo-lyase [Alphaproteobacteria bacterium]